MADPLRDLQQATGHFWVEFPFGISACVMPANPFQAHGLHRYRTFRLTIGDSWIPAEVLQSPLAPTLPKHFTIARTDLTRDGLPVWIAQLAEERWNALCRKS